MREIPTSLFSAVAAEENKPLELYEVYLDTRTLYFAQAEDTVALGTQTYTAIGISREPRASLRLGVDGAVGLLIRDRDEKLRAALGARADGVPGLGLYDSHEKAIWSAP